MRVLLRADAHQSLGGGHVMRQLALAQPLLARGDLVRLVSAQLDPALGALVLSRGIPVDQYAATGAGAEDAAALAELVTHHRADWVVLDDYRIEPEYVETIQAAGARVLVIDDFLNRARYLGDLLLNQNGSAPLESEYRGRGFRGRLLLGPEYALLRPEFSARATEPREIPPETRRLLVTMGSADAVGATEIALSALERVEASDMRIDVVVGAANPRGDGLRDRFRDPRIVWHQPARDMASLIARADLAIGAAGVTSLELCCLGLPALLMVVADNQELLAQTTEEAGAAINLGWYAEIDPRGLALRVDELRVNSMRRREMSEAGRRRVDGRGVGRVIAAMQEGDLS